MIVVCMGAKSLQSCLTLRNPMNCSPPGSSIQGFLQARTLEWVAMTSSRGFSRPTPLMSPVLAGGFFAASATWEAQLLVGVGITGDASDDSLTCLLNQ